jgi:hypothetical protein
MVEIADFNSEALVGFIEALLDRCYCLATRLHLMLAMQSVNCAFGTDGFVACETKV